MWYNFTRMSPPESGLTKNYRLVYDIVREQGRGMHLAPADVFSLAKTKHKGIGFTTVYRALARLRELGLVSEISLPGADSAYYEPAGTPHAHFRCDKCGAIEDMDYAIDPAVVGDLSRKHAIAVRDVSLSLHGTCRRCTDRAASAAG
jgi:Fe2+ or Zn2+ uptake regulation protein